MEYHGKLYGKVGNRYFDTDSTSQDFDELQQKVDELAEQVLKLNLDFVTQQRELLIAFHRFQQKMWSSPNAEITESVVDEFLKSNL